MIDEPPHMVCCDGSPPRNASIGPLVVNNDGNALSQASFRYLPVDAERLTTDAGRLLTHGAGMLHVQAEDGAGAPSRRPERVACVVVGMFRHGPDVVLEATTDGRQNGIQ